MRLLVIASDSIKGGATISLINTLLGLKKKGVEIFVIVPRSGFLTEVLEKELINYYVIPFGFSCWPQYLGIRKLPNIIRNFISSRLMELKATKKIKKIAEQLDPDIIHTNVSVINIGYNISKKLNKPHVWHIREYGDLDFGINVIPNRGFFKRKLEKSFSIAITNDLKAYNDNKPNCKVIYNGIFDSNYSAKSSSIKENRFIYVGRVTKSKGAEDLLRAFLHFSDYNPEFKLDFLGSISDDYKKELNSIISGTSAEGKVTFVGAIDDVYQRMQRAYAIIVPSYYEGFGRITAEAMFNDCLVVGRNTAGTKEQFDNGVKISGKEIGFRYNSNEELIMILKQISQLDCSQLHEYRRRAKQVVLKLYTNEKNVNEVYDFYKEILLAGEKED